MNTVQVKGSTVPNDSQRILGNPLYDQAMIVDFREHVEDAEGGLRPKKCGGPVTAEAAEVFRASLPEGFKACWLPVLATVENRDGYEVVTAIELHSHQVNPTLQALVNRRRAFV